jgi:eukaryotic-like serine/threonine-protein kinase
MGGFPGTGRGCPAVPAMSSATTSTRRVMVFRVAALLGILGAAVLFVVAAIVLSRHGERVPHRGWTGEFAGGQLIVREVETDGPADGRLAPGDLVVAVDGDRRLDRLTADRSRGFRGLFPPGLDYTLRVRRAGEDIDIALAAAERRDPAQLHVSQSLLAVAAVWCIVPALISIFRPGPLIAQLAFWACMCAGMSFLAEARLPAMLWAGSFAQTALTLAYPVSPIHLALAYDFYLRFPGASIALNWRRFRAALYVVCIALAVEGPLLDTMLRLVAPDRLPAVREALGPVDRWLYWVESFVYPVAFLGIFAVLVRSYRVTDSLDGRRRLHWLLWGTIVGLAPFTLVLLGMAATQVAGVALHLGSWIIAGNLFTAVIPITLGYAIIKHRVFDIRVVVRKGLQYLFARNALRALLAVPLFGLAYGLATNRDTPIGELLLSNRVYLYLLVAMLVSLWVRTRLMRWVDRRFFREAYDRERVLIELIEDVRELESASSVSRLVSQALETAFHPASLFIWYRDHDSPHLTLSYSSGGYIHRAELAPGSPLLRLIETRRSVIELPLADSESLPDADRQWLAEANVSCLVPVMGGGADVLGVLMLGPKKSEEPYSKDDLKLLQAMARQIGLGRENLRLHARVDTDRRIRHDVLSRLETGQFNLLKECARCGRCYDMVATHCEKDGIELTLTLPVERTLDDKYRLDRLLGRGGMGAVYEATDLRLMRTVAVKVLPGRAFGNQVALRRFEREAQACARLSHPNIVTVYDYGRAGADGAYLVMELIRGATLRVELKERGRIPPHLAAPWFDQICAAVGSAHRAGIVHRDLKPENVLISPASPGAAIVKVLDFGLAKMGVGADEASSLTEPGVVVGTLSYMAPEQLTGAALDQRCDVFAIGVMTAEAIAGTRPFSGRTHGELLFAMLNDAVELKSDSPAMAELQRVLRRATARDPDARYPSATELGAELGAALRFLASVSPPREDSTTTG